MTLNKKSVPLAQVYVKEELKLNNELCRFLASCLDFDVNSNSYFSFLPPEIIPEEIKDFSRGGIFPNATSTELSEYLWSRLKNEDDLIILFDDVMAKPSDDYLNKEESAKFFVNQEVYHYVNINNGSEKIILDAIYATGVSWHFLAVIFKDNNTQFFQKNLKELPSEFICKNLSEVIVGAYDGEGYIHFVKS